VLVVSIRMTRELQMDGVLLGLDGVLLGVRR
jgi:hypothetical protein